MELNELDEKISETAFLNSTAVESGISSIYEAFLEDEKRASVARRAKALFYTKICKFIVIVFVIFVSAAAVIAIFVPKKSETESSVTKPSNKCKANINIANGYVRTNLGATAQIVCNDGYKFNGQKPVACLHSDKSAEIPSCDPKSCERLPVVYNVDAKCNKDESIIGDEVTSSCLQAFYVEENQTIICQNNETFPKNPICIPIDCGIPSDTSNGIRAGLNSTLYGSTFGIECKEGFTMHGNQTVHCQKDGLWSTLPECKELSCKLPDIPSNAKIISIDGTTFNSSITFQCDEGFVVGGAKTSVCESNGTWSRIPVCIPVSCGIPLDVKHGIRTGFNATIYGSTFSIDCEEGFLLHGNETVYCGSNGRWSALPKCTEISCGLPDIPGNASIVAIDGITFKSQVIFKCLEGFVLKGFQKSICQSNGTWSSYPICIIGNQKDCFGIKQTNASAKSGVYRVRHSATSLYFDVYCDMETNGGGWTVFQKRFDGSTDFFRDYAHYESGFGNLTAEFWLGLKYVQIMTKNYETELRIDVTTGNGAERYMTYQGFNIGNTNKYVLSLSNEPGTGSFEDDPAIGLRYHDGMAFSSYDQDNDKPSSLNCGELFKSGWWFNNCFTVNLNGLYTKPGSRGRFTMSFPLLTGSKSVDNSNYVALKTSKMMFRRV